MNQDEALAAQQAIDEKQCDALLRELDARLSEPHLSAAINGVVGPVLERQAATRELIKSLTAQAPTPLPKPWETGTPVPMRTLWADDFDGPLDPKVWWVHGPENGMHNWGQTRGGKAVCTGIYHPSQVRTEGSALIITQERDPAGRTVHGRPAWLTGFIRTDGLRMFPVDCFIEAECEFDTSSPGNWWAPWWTGLWGSSNNEERDCEWFGNRADRIRFAYHVKDDTGELLYNTDSKVLGRSNDVIVPGGKPGARHRYAWWTRPCPEHPGHRKHTRYIDGQRAMEICTWELAQEGQAADAILNKQVAGSGVSLRICGQAEKLDEAGMRYASADTGPYEMKVHWIAVSVPA